MTDKLKQAIETVKEYLDMDSDVDSEYLNAQRTIIQALEAQPTDAEREAYIKGYDYGVKDWFKSKTQPCEDCVRREAVIRLVEQYPSIIGHRCSGLIADIKHLPSVTPQRPKGKWIEVLEHRDEFGSTWHYECSECRARSYKGFKPLERYCPNCGAKMSGGGEDDGGGEE